MSRAVRSAEANRDEPSSEHREEGHASCEAEVIRATLIGYRDRHQARGEPRITARALKSIRPQALRQLHDQAKARELKTVIEIGWRALERLDDMQRAALKAWFDGELQRQNQTS